MQNLGSSPGLTRYPLCKVLTLKNAHRESCESSFIWGRMRTIGDGISDSSSEAAPERQGEFSIRVILVNMCMPSSTFLTEGLC